MKKYGRIITQLFPVAVLFVSLFVMATFSQRVEAQEVQDLYPMSFRAPSAFTPGGRAYMESWLGEAIRPGTYPSSGQVNWGYGLPTSPDVNTYPTEYQGGPYHTANFYEAVAYPVIPDCVTNIRIAITGPDGTATNRFRTTREGSNGVGTWGTGSSEDYPEGAMILFDNDGFAGSDVLGPPVLMNDIGPGVSLTFGTGDISVSDRSRLVGVNPVRLYTYIELRDDVSNGGKQFRYIMDGSPYLRVKYDRSSCPNENAATCEVFSWGGFPNAESGERVAVADTNNAIINGAIAAPGQILHIGVRFKNTGLATWGRDIGQGRYGAFYSGDLVNDIQMSSVTPPGTNTTPFPTEQLTLPDGRASKRVYPRNPINVPTGSDTIFWFGFQVPANYTGSSLSARWQMAQFEDGFGGRAAGRFGQECAVTIRFPKNRPYLAVSGGDVVSGARFASQQLGACRATTAASFANIKTNGYYDTDSLAGLYGSSMSQYAVFASGVIGNDQSYGANNHFLGNYGYTRPILGLPGAKDVLFAHLGAVSPFEHGNFYSKSPTDPPMPCVDIRGLQQEAVATTTPNGFLNNAETGVRSFNGDVTIPTTNIANGQNKTLIVNGTVSISGDINQVGSYGDVSQIPSVTIIANNIRIETATRIINANLIAMPRPTGNPNVQQDGEIDTCYSAASPTWYSTAVISSCYYDSPSLVINGQVVARRVLWKRTGGTLGTRSATVSGCYFANYLDASDPPMIPFSGTPTEVSNASVARLEKCAAELIKVPADQYITRFRSQNMSVPISTIELPPIF